MFVPRHLLLLLSLTTFTPYASAAGDDEIDLAVANSTCTAIKEVGAVFEERSGVKLNYLCKSSGRLAKGLTGKAIGADIYISASKNWMDVMLDGGLVAQADVISPWGNKLVVAVPVTSHLELADMSSLGSEHVRTILIGDPGTAPFGRYAKQSLESSGQWDRVKRKIVTKKHITLLADTLAESNAETVGILFFSNINDRHRIAFTVDDSLHRPIRYYAAPLKASSENPAVMEMVRFLQGAEARDIFGRSGFKVFLD